MTPITLELPDDLAQSVAALPDADRRALLQKMNDFVAQNVLHALPPAYSNGDHSVAEPIDPAFIAELHEAFAEAERVGTMDFEEYVQQCEAESGPGLVERIRARVAANTAG